MMSKVRNGTRHLRVLVDMDGVLCDFEDHMLRLFRKKYPKEPFVLPKDRNTIFMHDQYEALKPGLGQKITDIMHEPEFFFTIPEIEGAVAAVREMSQLPEVDVFVCTSPINDPQYCAPEKFKWIQKHFGSDWVNRLILTSDKTMVTGDILIDDRHFITGGVNPRSWDHILFSQCHNMHLDHEHYKEWNIAGRLENWTDGSWYSLVENYLKRLKDDIIL